MKDSVKTIILSLVTTSLTLGISSLFAGSQQLTAQSRDIIHLLDTSKRVEDRVDTIDLRVQATATRAEMVSHVDSSLKPVNEKLDLLIELMKATAQKK